MRKFFDYWLIYLVSGLMLLASGTQAVTAQVEKSSLWRDAVITDLDVDFAGSGFHARWHYHRCHCGDLLIQVEQITPDGVLTGELLMVDGQVLLSRGFEEQGDDISSLMQAPSLMLQLVYALLNRSEPKGPAVITDKQLWDSREGQYDFSLNTGMATGMFAAPWSVKGSGWKSTAGQRRFELLFAFSNPTPEQPDESDSMTFSGNLDFRKQGFPYPETTRLEGWRIQWLSRGEKESSVVPEGLTLKDLREQTKG